MEQPSPDKQINSSPEDVESPSESSTKGAPSLGLDAKRFYGKLDVKEAKIMPANVCTKQGNDVKETRKRRPSKKTSEALDDSSTEVVPKRSKRCKQKNQSDFNMSRDTEGDVISSVEASEETTQHFMDTPAMDETPMCDRKVALCKNWVQQLNDKLENIEAVTTKKQVSVTHTNRLFLLKSRICRETTVCLSLYFKTE